MSVIISRGCNARAKVVVGGGGVEGTCTLGRETSNTYIHKQTENGYKCFEGGNDRNLTF